MNLDLVERVAVADLEARLRRWADDRMHAVCAAFAVAMGLARMNAGEVRRSRGSTSAGRRFWASTCLDAAGRKLACWCGAVSCDNETEIVVEEM